MKLPYRVPRLPAWLLRVLERWRRHLWRSESAELTFLRGASPAAVLISELRIVWLFYYGVEIGKVGCTYTFIAEGFSSSEPMAHCKKDRRYVSATLWCTEGNFWLVAWSLFLHPSTSGIPLTAASSNWTTFAYSNLSGICILTQVKQLETVNNFDWHHLTTKTFPIKPTVQLQHTWNVSQAQTTATRSILTYLLFLQSRLPVSDEMNPEADCSADVDTPRGSAAKVTLHFRAVQTYQWVSGNGGKCVRAVDEADGQLATSRGQNSFSYSWYKDTAHQYFPSEVTNILFE